MTIQQHLTLQAIAYQNGMADSPVTNGVYTSASGVLDHRYHHPGLLVVVRRAAYVYGSQGYVLCAWTANATPPTGIPPMCRA